MTNVTCVNDAGIADIPVKIFTPWGRPILVGHAIFDDTKHVRIEFLDHEFVECFYDLNDQEMTMSISFKYVDEETPHLRPLEQGEIDWS